MYPRTLLQKSNNYESFQASSACLLQKSNYRIHFCVSLFISRDLIGVLQLFAPSLPFGNEIVGYLQLHTSLHLSQLVNTDADTEVEVEAATKAVTKAATMTWQYSI